MRISDWSSDVCSSDLLAVVSLGLVLFAGRLALSTRRSRVVSGMEEMIGSIAVVQDWSDGQGHVFVHGERWNAVSATPLDTGERVQIIALDGLTLRVVLGDPDYIRSLER